MTHTDDAHRTNAERVPTARGKPFSSLRAILEDVSPKDEIVVVGVNPLAAELEASAEYFEYLFGVEHNLRLSLIVESDNENFGQAVVMSAAAAVAAPSSAPDSETVTYTELNIRRDRIAGTVADTGLAREVEEHAPHAAQRTSIRDRMSIKQLNLRLPVNIIKADDRIWSCITTYRLPTAAAYVEVEPDNPEYEWLCKYVEFLLNPEGAGAFQSSPGDELIWVYDRMGIPRGIFPRAAFYTVEYARYSVWGFVLNRQGKILLQQRSLTTKDNRGLWDKSIGGHVDLEDASTSITAKRELVEEMYLPRAEFTKHVRADLGDLIDFGEWNPKKRPERYFREAFAALGDDDWVMFRATNPRTGLPLTIDRISERRWHTDDGSEPGVRRTVFMSDVYFFIAPEGKLESDASLRADLAESERGGAAASDHKLLAVDELRRWVAEVERAGDPKKVFTDDLLYMLLEHDDLLESLSSFASFVFGKPSRS